MPIALLFIASLVAGAIALATGETGRLGFLARRYPRFTWLLPRLVLIAAALTAMVGLIGGRGECPDRSFRYSSGELLYARQIGDTLVCHYQSTGGGL